MKTSKKVFIFAFCLLLVFVAIFAFSFVSSKKDRAALIYANDSSYVLLNDSQKYCYMPYYDYKFQPDLKIRYGYKSVTDLFNKSFGAYSNDSERNFLYCNQGGFGIQTVGLYVKEESLEKLFKPNAKNIYSVTVYDKDLNKKLCFNSKDRNIFNCFIKEYASELNDYFFPNDNDNENIFNDEYSVYVEYQGGKISRFLRCIDEKEFEALNCKSK